MGITLPTPLMRGPSSSGHRGSIEWPSALTLRSVRTRL